VIETIRSLLKEKKEIQRSRPGNAAHPKPTGFIIKITHFLGNANSGKRIGAAGRTIE
jgi:hypothetical protein